MITKRLLPIVSLLPLASAASASSTILSCADVLCPLTGGGTTSALCTVVDSSYHAVGVASVPSRPDLSWVQGVSTYDARELDGDGNPNPNPDNPMKRTFINDFYLASEPGAELSGGACALFFRNVTKDADWPPVPNHTTSQGTCADAIGEACVEAMVKRARAVDVEGLGAEEACEKVRREFEREAQGGEEGGGVCKKFSGAKGWRGVVGKVIGGKGAPEPITEAQNASSNCWPVQPKDRDLTLVAKFNSTGGFMASELIDELFGMTPILTVFFPTGNASGGARSEVQLTCLKAVDETTATEENKSDGTPNSAGDMPPQGVMGVFIALGVVGLLSVLG